MESFFWVGYKCPEEGYSKCWKRLYENRNMYWNERGTKNINVSDVADVIRGSRQPARSVHLLFPLRTQHDRALRVAKRFVQNSDIHDEHFQHGASARLHQDHQSFAADWCGHRWTGLTRNPDVTGACNA